MTPLVFSTSSSEPGSTASPSTSYFSIRPRPQDAGKRLAVIGGIKCTLRCSDDSASQCLSASPEPLCACASLAVRTAVASGSSRRADPKDSHAVPSAAKQTPPCGRPFIPSAASAPAWMSRTHYCTRPCLRTSADVSTPLLLRGIVSRHRGSDAFGRKPPELANFGVPGRLFTGPCSAMQRCRYRPPDVAAIVTTTPETWTKARCTLDRASTYCNPTSPPIRHPRFTPRIFGPGAWLAAPSSYRHPQRGRGRSFPS